MGEFVCRVADGNGRVFSHVEAAGTLAEARQKLLDRGLYVYSVSSRSGVIGGFTRRRERTIGGSDFLILNQQFNTLIKAGLPILRALDLLADRASSPKLRPVISQIRDRVREGKSLSEAVSEAGVFSKVYSTAILAGEKSGNLSGVLEYYIAYQKVSTGVRKKILATLVYPALLIIVATIVVTYLVTAVIPKFSLLYRDLNVELPAPTKVLIALTVDYRYALLGMIGGVIVLALAIYFVVAHRRRWRSLRSTEIQAAGNRGHHAEISGGAVLPHFGNAADRRHTAGGWACKPRRTPSAANSSAAPSARRRRWCAKENRCMRALASKNVMPELALDMIEVGESCGALGPMLTSVAEFYEDEVNLRLSAMVSLIEPVILDFYGLVGGIYPDFVFLADLFFLRRESAET